MTKAQKQQYQNPEALKDIINRLRGMKFNLDCGHVVTFGYFLGNDITIRNGKHVRIICSQCGY
ncbi:MAG: hypothetical protein C4518_16210 [Desulfobacteraceae bacterium]|nr:MAG: hypothetical protein C4518_16210 [Desulfobacteraceae bacterium]